MGIASLLLTARNEGDAHENAPPKRQQGSSNCLTNAPKSEYPGTPEGTERFHSISPGGKRLMLAKLLTKTNGMIGALVGLIVAVVGLVVKFTTVHQKTGWGLLVIGIVLLVIGGYAYLTTSKTPQAR
jgi:predicted histidine transporter YuiF (NhaC family)